MDKTSLSIRIVGFALVVAGTVFGANGCNRGEKKSTHKTTFQVTASREYYAEADETHRPMRMVGHLNHAQMRERSDAGKEFFIARFDKERRLIAVEKKVRGVTVLRVDYNYTDKKIQELRWVPKPAGAASAKQGS